MAEYTSDFFKALEDESVDYSAGEPEGAQFAPGATEPTTTGGALGSGGYEAASPPDPRLGTNPQGEWSREKMTTMFPEMFKLDTSDWLDPAEEAKKRMGLAYDPTKKYNEKAEYPGLDKTGASAPMDRRAMLLKGDRRMFEEQIFNQFGNPFLMSPEEEVLKADAQLPQLFEHIFGGRVSFSDIGRLSKTQREIWEEAKKRHHAQVYGAAKAKKQKAEEAYKWMMGNFEWERAQAAKELEERDKREAKEEARRNKAPDTRVQWSSKHQAQTLHIWDPTTQDWADTGRQTESPMKALQESLNFVNKQIKQIAPEEDDENKKLLSSLLIGKAPEDQEKIKAMFGIRERTQQELEQIGALKAQRDRLLSKYNDASNQQPAGAAPAPDKTQQYDDAQASKAIQVLVDLDKRNDPKTKGLIEAFLKRAPGKANELLTAIRKSRKTTKTTNPSEAKEGGVKPATPKFPDTKDKPGLLRQLSIWMNEGNHVAWDSVKKGWKALDDIGKWMIKAAVEADVELGKIARGEISTANAEESTEE